jgi:hypothetical protein
MYDNLGQHLTNIEPVKDHFCMSVIIGNSFKEHEKTDYEERPKMLPGLIKNTFSKLIRDVKNKDAQSQEKKKAFIEGIKKAKVLADTIE